MMWQDFVFMAGSLLSVAFLAPTLRDAAARVPLATSLPSTVIGGAYAMTFFSLGMTFSAIGAGAACTMWSSIALFRSPESPLRSTSRALSMAERRRLFLIDCRRWARRLIGHDDAYAAQFVESPSDGP